MLLAILLSLQVQLDGMPDYNVKIIDIRSNYCIASDGLHKTILYNLEDVSLHDTLTIKGKYEPIVSTMNDGTFNFSDYCKHKRIFYSMYVTNYHIRHTSHSFIAKIYRKIQSLQDKHKELVNRILYRIKDTEDTMNNYLYMSGMHISFIILCISKLLHKNYTTCAIIGCLIYSVLFPIQFFIIRIFIFSLVETCFPFNKKEVLGCSIWILLLCNPNSIYEISFILPVCMRLVSEFNISRIKRQYVGILIVIPIFLYQFNEINLLQLFCFTIYRYYYGSIVLLALVSIYIPMIVPIIEKVLSLENVLSIKSCTIFTIIGKPIGLWMLIWFFVVYRLLENKQIRYYAYIVILLLLQMHMKDLNPFYEVTYLDVGQGDTILIREPFLGDVMLIDCAGKEGKNVPHTNIVPYLKKEGIKKIDKVSISHNDYDHSGGLKDLMNEIPVDEIQYDKKDIQLKYTNIYSISHKEYEEENDNSVVLFMKVFDTSFIFMGDASIKTESDILRQYGNLQADVIKLGHHGSNTSSSEPFIHTLNSTYAIVSAGRNNTYGHPHKKVLDILEKNKIQIFNTQNDGSISFYFLSKMKWIKTGNNEICWMK